MWKIKRYIAGAFAILAVLLAFKSATDILQGNLEPGLTPGWIGFATSHPMLFAFILVAGAAVFGTPFVSAFDNY
jgi:hypothetical protein